MDYAALLTKVVTKTETHNNCADTHAALFATILSRAIVEEAWRLFSSDPPDVAGAQDMTTRLYGDLTVPTTHKAKRLMGWTSAVNEALSAATRVVETRVRAAREFLTTAPTVAETTAAPKGKAKATAPKGATSAPAAKASSSSGGPGDGKASAPVPPSGGGGGQGDGSDHPGGRPLAPPIPELPAQATHDPLCADRRVWENYACDSFWKGRDACSIDDVLEWAQHPEHTRFYLHDGLTQGGDNDRIRRKGTYPRLGDNALGCFAPAVAHANSPLAKPLASLAANNAIRFPRRSHRLTKHLHPWKRCGTRVIPPSSRRCSKVPIRELRWTIVAVCGVLASLA
jgi:hypothetical protein